MNAPDKITVSVPVLNAEDAADAPPHVLERSELPPMPGRRSDAETRQRALTAKRRRAEQGPYMRVVITP